MIRLLLLLVLSQLYIKPAYSMIAGMSLHAHKALSESFHSKEEALSLFFDPKEWKRIDTSKAEDILVGFQSKKTKNLQFTIQVDHLERFPSEAPSLKKYLHFYAKRFPRAGIVLMSDIEKSIHDYYAQLDMELPDQKKWVHQSLIWHPANKVFIFTCKGDKETKKEDQKSSCLKLSQSLRWN